VRTPKVISGSMTHEKNCWYKSARAALAGGYKKPTTADSVPSKASEPTSASRSHDEATIESLLRDLDYASVYFLSVSADGDDKEMRMALYRAANVVAALLPDRAAVQPAASASEPRTCPECNGTRHLHNGPTRVDCDVCEATGVVPPASVAPTENHWRKLAEGPALGDAVQQSASRPHDEATAESFARDPAYAAAYLRDVLKTGDHPDVDLALKLAADAFDLLVRPPMASLTPDCDCTRQSGCRRQTGRWCKVERFERTADTTPTEQQRERQ
jgi:hypothetical protein